MVGHRAQLFRGDHRIHIGFDFKEIVFHLVVCIPGQSDEKEMKVPRVMWMTLCFCRYIYVYFYVLAFPGGSDGKEPACNAGDPSMIPGSERFPWRREWLLTLVFLPVESHGQRSLVGYSPWVAKQLDMAKWLNYIFMYIFPHRLCYFPLSPRHVNSASKLPYL